MDGQMIALGPSTVGSQALKALELSTHERRTDTWRSFHDRK